MFTVKQIFELALRCAIQDYEDMLLKHKNVIMAKKYKRDVDEIMDVLINIDKKENYIVSSNPGIETAVLFALNLKDGDVQKLKAKPKSLYQVRITHLTGEEQVLRFPIQAAASSTFELLKYELKVGRIRGAKIVRVIPSVGMKETLVSIGETEEEDIF